jgi:hypothetical protein
MAQEVGCCTHTERVGEMVERKRGRVAKSKSDGVEILLEAWKIVVVIQITG